MELHRNPFRLLKTEQISNDSSFHYLFEPQIIQYLQYRVDTLWDRLQIIRSAPGGGKTSLLRLFTVESLTTIHKKRSVADLSNLVETLERLGALGKQGPQVFGVCTSCSRPFSYIEDLSIDERKRDRLFYTLLNSRVLLGVLKAICVFVGGFFPKDLDKVEIIPDIEIGTRFKNIFGTIKGLELYQVACTMEKEVFAVIDSIGEPDFDSMPGVSDLILWKSLSPGSIRYNGRPINIKTLLMLDDVHDLSRRQRAVLIRDLEGLYPTSRWVAERFDALGIGDTFKTASTRRREYEEHRIEEWATQQKSKNYFHKGLGAIADRRVKFSKAIEVASFETLLENPLLDKDIIRQCSEAKQQLAERVKNMASSEKRFQPWINEIENINSSEFDTAVQWRALEILIKRKQQRSPTLFPDLELTTEELNKMDSTNVHNAAKLFTCKEFDISYYNGIDSLKSLSSGNVEQFLEIAGEIFEGILSSVTIRKVPSLSPSRQEAIVRKLAKDRLNQIPQRLTYGIGIHKLILQIGKLAREKTYNSTAPYAPGVTGIAITSYDQRMLSDNDYLERHPDDAKLANVLREAIANNILEPRPRQLCKNQEWLVLYLNRLLCVCFDLPLEYGGWREQTLSTLKKWIMGIPAMYSTQKGLFDE